MSKETTKLIIAVVFLVIFIAGIVTLCLMDVNLGFINTSSIRTLLSQKDTVSNKEKELVQKQTKYTTTLQSLETAKSDYQKEKAKYEAISNETIDIIKEATTKENYNIEYMWIKLGNYAKTNNLTLIVVEPGGTSSSVAASSAVTPATGTTTTPATSTTSSTTSSATSTTTPAPAASTTSGSDEMKIELTGNYIDTSEFIFEVENDSELKFKLDNISITYVEGTTIKTTFTVKGMTIKK
jgi:hypothetical protein